MSFDAPPLYEGDVVRRLRFGTQLDSRPIATARRSDDPDRALTPEQVAGYLAKYATKAATDSTDTEAAHARRLRATIADVTDRIHADARADATSLRHHPYRLLWEVAAHARLPRPLLHQVPPLLAHPRIAPPETGPVPAAPRRRPPRGPDRRRARPRRPPCRRRQGNHPGHRALEATPVPAGTRTATPSSPGPPQPAPASTPNGERRSESGPSQQGKRVGRRANE